MDAIDSRIVDPGVARTESQATIAAQNWKLLSLYNYYRLVISVSATTLALTGINIPPFGLYGPILFLFASVLYAVIAVVSFFTIRRGRPDFETQVTLQIFADITLITLLMHASGGVASGLGLLLLVAVAASSLMLDKRLTVC